MTHAETLINFVTDNDSVWQELSLLLVDIGSYHYVCEADTEAKRLIYRLLSFRVKVLGPDHPDVATSLNNLAALLKTQGKYAEAEPLYRRALAIDEKALGKDHPDVAIDLNNLALLLKTQGKFAATEPLFRRALAIDEKALGKDHPTTVTIRSNLNSLPK